MKLEILPSKTKGFMLLAKITLGCKALLKKSCNNIENNLK